MQPSGVPLDDLLIHAEFLRRLARDLVGDASGGDDLAQQVWLQALRKPPRTADRLRAWLATTARNLLANRRREDARRAAREALAAPLDRAPSVADVLAREAARESVLRAVLALDEPMREAVLLRYYEDISPLEIARRLGIPAGTVRSRISRGLACLRERLDIDHGNRSTWALLVAPWVSASRPRWILHGALMMKKTAIALLVVMLCLAVWRFSVAARPDAPDGAAVAGPLAVHLDREDDRGRVSAASAPNETQRTPIAAHAPGEVPHARRLYPADRGRGSIHGIVFDEQEQPLRSIPVRAVPHPGATPPGLVVEDDRKRTAETLSDETGQFTFPDVDEGPVKVEALFADGTCTKKVVVLGRGEDVGPVRLARQEARAVINELRVLVVDPTGEPVAGAHIEAYGWSRTQPDPAVNEAGFTHPIATGTSGPDGRAVLEASSLAAAVVWATSLDGRAGRASFIDLPVFQSQLNSERELRVVVAPVGRISGEITGVSESDLVGAKLALRALTSTEPYYSSIGRRIDVELTSTHFFVDDLAAGTYVAMLDARSSVRLVLPPLHWSGGRDYPNSVGPMTIIVESGHTTEVTLPAAPGGLVRGRVTTSGAPVVGARVRAVLAPRTSNFPAGYILHGVHVWRFDGEYENGPMSPISSVLAVTDANGGYELLGLTPGSYRIEVSYDGLSLDRRMDVRVEAGAAVELRHELIAAGVLQVAATGANFLGVTRAGEQQPVMLAITRDDFATFAGLPAGRYVVGRFHSDEKVAVVPLGEAVVEAGRTTWLDLRGAGLRAHIRGVVRAGGAAVARARVGMFRMDAITASDGSFELRLPSMPKFTEGFLGTQLSVRNDVLAYRFVPASEDTAEDLDVDLDLGPYTLQVVARDVAGEGAAVRAELEWTPSGRAEHGPISAMCSTPSAEGSLSIGPLPAGHVEGRLVFGNGWSADVAIDLPRTEPLTVVRPSTATLHVRTLAHGRPAPNRSIVIRTTNAAGALGSTWYTRGVTDGDGALVIAVAAGDVDLTAETGAKGSGARSHVEPGGDADVILEIE